MDLHSEEKRNMLHCNMNATTAPILLSLEDLLGDLHHARRSGDMGRLALLAYCEVRRWARHAGEHELADRSTALITQSPLASRDEFMTQVDALIEDLERAHARVVNQPTAEH